MNLHGIAAPLIAAVNPMTAVSIQVSTGESAVGADGSRTPAFAPPVAVDAQIQAMTWRDLQMTEGLNLQGTRRKIYLYGRFDGVVRPLAKGGDLITIATGGVNDGVWLIAQVLEQFPDWCSVAATLQNRS